MADKENCKAKDCSREVVGKGYCRMHFRLWKAGEMPKPRYKTCTFEKCHKIRSGTSSLCDEHFKAKHGKAAANAPAGAAPEAAAAEALRRSSRYPDQRHRSRESGGQMNFDG